MNFNEEGYPCAWDKENEEDEDDWERRENDWERDEFRSPTDKEVDDALSVYKHGSDKYDEFLKLQKEKDVLQARTDLLVESSKVTPMSNIGSPTQKINFSDVIADRQMHCLTVLDKIISSPPSEMERIVQEYEKVEAVWKYEDEVLGFDFEEFLKRNGNFVEMLNKICGGMKVNSNKKMNDEFGELMKML